MGRTNRRSTTHSVGVCAINVIAIRYSAHNAALPLRHKSSFGTAAMTNLLSEMLATRPWLLADGATGTNLFARGLQHGPVQPHALLSQVAGIFHHQNGVLG